MSEFVVVGSNSLRDSFLALHIPVSTVDTNITIASQRIYELATQQELAGILVFMHLDPNWHDWISKYAASGVYVMIAGNNTLMPNAVPMALPTRLQDVIDALGYRQFNIMAPDGAMIDSNGVVSSPQSPPVMPTMPPTVQPTVKTAAQIQPVVGLPIPVLFSISGKGGVGKTTVGVIQAARFAARYYNYRVLVVDGNAGQGDIRRYLKMHWDSPKLPDISIYGPGVRWQDVVVKSEVVAQQARINSPITFDIVFAPAHMTEKDTVDPPADAYLRLVQEIESDPDHPYDLIIIDTQIIETNYPGVMIRSFIVPVLQKGAYAVGVFDNSTPGYNNTKQAISLLSGLSKTTDDHFAFIANKLDAKLQLNSRSIDGIWLAGQLPNQTLIAQILAGDADPSASNDLQYTIAQLLERVIGPIPKTEAPGTDGDKKKRRMPFPRRKK